MSGALPQQPEEFLDHVRNVPHDHVPSVEEELDEFLMLTKVSGEYPDADENLARSIIVKRRQRGLLLSFVAMVFVSLANKVFQKNLVSRDGFSRPVPRQPAHLHTQAESGAYLRDSLPSSAVAEYGSTSMENTSYVFSFRMVFFYLVTTGWVFYISLCRVRFHLSNGTGGWINDYSIIALEPTIGACVYLCLGTLFVQYLECEKPAFPYQLETIPMYNYPNFLNLFTTFMYIPFSFAYIIPMLRYGNSITPEQTSIPKRVFAVMGALDGLSGIMQIFASTYLGGSLIILLTQAAIPISMAISKRLTGARYSMTQYAGAVVVSMGIVIAIGPSLAVGGGGNEVQELIWSVVLVLSCVPMALSSVYKEMALGESELDPIYLNGWVAVFQFLICLPLAVPAALVGNPPVSPIDLPGNLLDGWRCFWGYNSVVIGEHPDRCWPGGPMYVNLYLVANINFNILIVLLLKYGSANILFLAMTICVPLGNVVFALPFVSGHQPLHVTDILGLIFVLTGLIVYRFGPQLYNTFGHVFSFDAGAARTRLTAASVRGRAFARGEGSGPSGSALPLGEHRKPLLDLVDEEEDDVDDGLYDRSGDDRGRHEVGRAQSKDKPPRAIEDEWEM